VTRYTVMLCCNDERGMWTGRVSEIEIADEIRIECPGQPSSIRINDERVRIGRREYPCRGRQVCVGNVFWDSITMALPAALALVVSRINAGWTVVEYAENGPFAEIARSAR
jgi:hypothetical protein